MSGILHAIGFIAEKPELTLVGARQVRKCEFEVVWTRRAHRDGQWQSVYERATFVAWNDQAEACAEQLDKGIDVHCVGEQETSSWTPQGATKPVYRTKYTLHWWQRVGRRKPLTEGSPDEPPRAPRVPSPATQPAPVRPPPAAPAARYPDADDPFPGPLDDGSQEQPGRHPPTREFIEM